MEMETMEEMEITTETEEVQEQPQEQLQEQLQAQLRERLQAQEQECRREAISRRARIRFKLLMNYYHFGEKTKSVDIVKEMGVAKSEVSAIIALLVQQGYLTETKNKHKMLTNTGLDLAYQTHRKYEIAYQMLCGVYENQQEAAESAEILVITMRDCFFEKPVLLENRSSLAQQVSSLVEFSGTKLCQMVKPGVYMVHISFLTYFDVDAPKENGKPHGVRMGHPGGIAMPQSSSSDIYGFKERHSMANGAFVQPSFMRFEGGKGVLRLHRQVIRRKNQDGDTMVGKAQEIFCHNGKEFVRYSFVGDDIDIPVEHFFFNLLHDEYHGTAIMRFSCTVGEMYMPPSVAKIDVVL